MLLSRIPDHIVYMKSGVFAGEQLDSILKRKRDEYEAAGCFFWGYSGTICHPRTQLRPFATQVVQSGQKPYLIMSYTRSELQQEAKPATHFSIDKQTWSPLPSGINVYGSRYAVICGAPQPCELPLDFQTFVVAIGRRANRPLHEYIRRRVDKACARRNSEPTDQSTPNSQATIFWLAEIIEPYAVFLQ